MMCLGVMKKLMRLWLKIKNKHRLSEGLKIEIAIDSDLLKNDCPSEFINKIRGFDQMSKFKAKEYRAILGYWGMIIFKKYLPTEQYNHFMRFCCAFRILASDFARDEQYVSYAHKLLDRFVKGYGPLYGQKEMVRNVHGLLHIVDDVRRYGRLDDFSAFKFESFLAPLKNLIHGPTNPLEQVHNKLMTYRASNRNIINSTNPSDEWPQFEIMIRSINDDDGNCYKKLLLPNITIKTKHPNNIVMLSDGKPFVVERIVMKSHNDGLIRGRKFSKLGDFFRAPLESSRLNIHLATGPMSNLKTYGVSDIRYKCISTKLNRTQSVIIPLLHF